MSRSRIAKELKVVLKVGKQSKGERIEEDFQGM